MQPLKGKTQNFSEKTMIQQICFVIAFRFLSDYVLVICMGIDYRGKLGYCVFKSLLKLMDSIFFKC